MSGRDYNTRFHLRAFEASDPIRLATVLTDLPIQPWYPRDVLVDAWSRRWPKHGASTSRRSVRGRITSTMPFLRTAGIIDYAEGGPVEIAHRGLLEMVAGNAAIVLTENGDPIPPAQWRARPAVPDYLIQVQDRLWAKRATG